MRKVQICRGFLRWCEILAKDQHRDESNFRSIFSIMFNITVYSECHVIHHKASLAITEAQCDDLTQTQVTVVWSDQALPWPFIEVWQHSKKDVDWRTFILVSHLYGVQLESGLAGLWFTDRSWNIFTYCSLPWLFYFDSQYDVLVNAFGTTLSKNILVIG